MTETEYTITPALVKDPAEARTFDVDFYAKCVQLWRPNEQVSVGEFMRPSVPNGFAYRVTNAGTTGAKEPLWPKVIDQTIPSGSATFECSTAVAQGLNAITSPAVTSDPAGLTVTAVSVQETRKIRCTVSGGLDGQDYDLVYGFTLDAVSRVARLKVQVRKR
jgi:hypothetical protein